MIFQQSFFRFTRLYLIGRTVNHQPGISTFDSNETEKNEFDKKSFGTYFVLRAIRFREFFDLTWHVCS